jgi:hypothetical protein
MRKDSLQEGSNLPSSYPLEDLHEALASPRKEEEIKGKTKERMNKGSKR